MFKTLSPGAIHVSPADLSAALRYAKLGGFAGLECWAPSIADQIDKEGAPGVKKLFDDAGVIPAGWGLPVDWRTSEENWKRDLGKLPRLARAAASLGASRCFTWVMPCSDERPLEENYTFHVERFAPIAQVLAEYGCRLGLEFIGPKTLRDSKKYPFIHTMSDMVQLGRDIGKNVGLLLDCWHWYTSGGTVPEIRKLRPEQVVYVHVNDAPSGIDRDRQIDSVRCLPGETGVIDIVGFLQALQAIGYEGPVVPEPFKAQLKELPSDEDRLKLVGQSMLKVWRQAGLG
jgi:sugar phosphate isomerase/epimerase